jgi:hypothetical protein
VIEVHDEALLPEELGWLETAHLELHELRLQTGRLADAVNPDHVLRFLRTRVVRRLRLLTLPKTSEMPFVRGFLEIDLARLQLGQWNRLVDLALERGRTVASLAIPCASTTAPRPAPMRAAPEPCELASRISPGAARARRR